MSPRNEHQFLLRSLLLLVVGGCGGEDGPTVPTEDPPTTWVTLSTGQTTACGIVQSGDLYCWGVGNRGQLGTGQSGGTSVVDPDAYKEVTPALVEGGHAWKMVSVGNELTCGISTEDDAYCWGTGDFGSIGDGQTGEDRTTPTLVAGGHKWSQVRASRVAACGVTLAGDGYCWGTDNGGVGMITGVDGGSTTPALVTGGHKWQDIRPDHQETCGLTDVSSIYCWGSDVFGQLGNGPDDSTDMGLVLVSGGHEWSELAKVGSTACALTSTGTAYCWGADSNGALGDGAPADAGMTEPTAVAGGHVFAWMTGKCGINVSGLAFCWGAGHRGQLGNGMSGLDPFYFEPAPVQVAEGNDWVMMDTFLNNSCAIDGDGRAFCWGYGAQGALGNGTTPDVQAIPIEVSAPSAP